jgi:hypothetical protein
MNDLTMEVDNRNDIVGSIRVHTEIIGDSHSISAVIASLTRLSKG